MSESVALIAARGLFWGLATVALVGAVGLRLVCWPGCSAVAPPARAPLIAPVPAASGAAPTLHGVVELGPELARRVPAGAVVFLTLRGAGSSEGAPIAAKRLPATGFPLAFSIQPDDSMLGKALPGRIAVEAHLDADGDAGTRQEDAPQARIDGVEPGAEVRLVLR